MGLLAIGAGGALATLGLRLYSASCVLLRLGLLRGDGYLFPAQNLVAAMALLFSFFEVFNPCSAQGELAWIIVGLVEIVRLFVVRRKLEATTRHLGLGLEPRA